MDSPSSLLCGEKLVFSGVPECCMNPGPKSVVNFLGDSGFHLGSGLVFHACACKSASVGSRLSSSWRRRRGAHGAAVAACGNFLQSNSVLPRPAVCRQLEFDDGIHGEAQQQAGRPSPGGLVSGFCGAGVEIARPSTGGSDFQESIALLLEKEAQPFYKCSDFYVQSMVRASGCGCGHPGQLRRQSVHLILKLCNMLQLSTLVAAHAVAFLDRFLSYKCSEWEQNDDMLLAAAACFWIAAKMEDSATPNLSTLLACESAIVPPAKHRVMIKLPGKKFDLSLFGMIIQGLRVLDYDEETILKTEVQVLRALGWRMLSVTTSDFVGSIVADLQVLGLFHHRLMDVAGRADEIIRGILPEEEFLAYEPSVVSICVIQCLLDETVPVQAAVHMASIRRALAVDMVAARECYKLLIDLVVDPVSECNIPSP